MKRYEKALLDYPNDIVAHKTDGIIKDTKIYDCCPYYLDAGEDDLDESTRVGDYGSVTGCRGITCIECWDKLADQ